MGPLLEIDAYNCEPTSQLTAHELQVSPATVIAMAWALSHARDLTSLTLRGSELTPAAVARLACALRDPECSLRHLSLEDNDFTVLQINAASHGSAVSEGKAAEEDVAAAVEESKAAGGTAGLTWAQAVASLLGPTSPLQTLMLQNCGLQADDMPLLAHAVAASPELTAFSIAGNSIGDAGLRSLIPALARHPTLEQLSIADIGCTAQGLASLLQHIGPGIVASTDPLAEFADASTAAATELEGTVQESIGAAVAPAASKGKAKAKPKKGAAPLTLAGVPAFTVPAETAEEALRAAKFAAATGRDIAALLGPTAVDASSKAGAKGASKAKGGGKAGAAASTETVSIVVGMPALRELDVSDNVLGEQGLAALRAALCAPEDFTPPEPELDAAPEAARPQTPAAGVGQRKIKSSASVRSDATAPGADEAKEDEPLQRTLHTVWAARPFGRPTLLHSVFVTNASQLAAAWPQPELPATNLQPAAHTVDTAAQGALAEEAALALAEHGVTLHVQ